MRRARAVTAVAFLAAGWMVAVSQPAAAAETAVQEGSDPFIPGFRHFTVIAPSFDAPVGPGQGRPLGALTVFGYFPDLLEGRLKLQGEWSDSFVDLNLSTPGADAPARLGARDLLEVGAGFSGELLSAESTLYAYHLGRRLRPFEFFTSTYAGKAFARVAPTATEDAKLTYQYRVYEFGHREGRALFVPADLVAHIVRLDLNSVRKRLTVPEAEELDGREYNLFVEGHVRERVERDGSGLGLAAARSQSLLRVGASLQNFFTLDGAQRHRLTLGLRTGAGGRQDYLSLFRLGSFQDGNGNAALPGYFFSEVRAEWYTLADASYTYRQSPWWKVQVEAHYGAARQFELPTASLRTRQFLSIAAGLEVKIFRVPLNVQYGYAPLVPRGTLRSTPHGGHEILVGTFLVF